MTRSYCSASVLFRPPRNDEIKEYADNQIVTKDKLMPIQRHCEEVFPTRQSRR
jgi:hypothetical protein